MVLPSPQDCTASEMPSIKPGQSHDLLLWYLTSAYSLPKWEYHSYGYTSIGVLWVAQPMEHLTVIGGSGLCFSLLHECRCV